MNVHAAAAVGLFAALASGNANAACSDFEREVAQIIRDVEGFRESAKFKEYGWSGRAPFKRYLDRLQELRDHPEAGDYGLRHGFAIIEIYSVADEFRTSGGLDSFWRDVDLNLKRAPRC